MWARGRFRENIERRVGQKHILHFRGFWAAVLFLPAPSYGDYDQQKTKTSATGGIRRVERAPLQIMVREIHCKILLFVETS